MTAINITNIVYVDGQFGNDATGQLDTPDFKFKTFDGAYQKIETLENTSSRPPYTISLSEGKFVTNLSLYENIAIDATNDNVGIMPRVLIPRHEIQWNGLIWNDVELCIDIDPFEARESILIVGESSIEATCKINIDNYTTEIPLKLYQSKKEQYQVKQIDPSLIKAIFVSERVFKAAARPAILAEVFFIFTFLKNCGISIRGLPAEYNGDQQEAVLQFIDTFVGKLGSVVFQGVGEKEPSALYYAFDIILALFEQPDSEDSDQIPVIMDNVNYSVNKTTDQITADNFLLKLTQEACKPPDTIKKNTFIIEENVITRALRAQILQFWLAEQENIRNRLGSSDNMPKIAIVDSNITHSGNQLCVTDNMEDYFVDNSNMSGVLLNENNDELSNLNNDTYPILNIHDQEGSNIERGSKFLRYRCITTNYTHNRLDGEFFFVDASNSDIKIIIPLINNGANNSNNMFWRGRTLSYKRVDKSNHQVVIINERGTIEGKRNKIYLNNEKCYDEGKKLPFVRLMIREDGNAYKY